MSDKVLCSSCDAWTSEDATGRSTQHENWHEYIDDRFGDLEREVYALQALISRFAPGWVGED